MVRPPRRGQALATRTGDTAAKMLGVKANRSKPAAPHVAVAVKEKAEAGRPRGM